MKFEDIDFNEIYKEQKEKKVVLKQKSKEAWDKKAVSMNQRVHNSIYNEQFLKQINLDGIESLLDVGCGVGNLSLIFAKKLKMVYSLDYSTKMLEVLKKMQKKNFQI